MTRHLILATALLWSATTRADELTARALFESKKARLKIDDEGHVVRLMHGGDPRLTLADLERIPELVHLEELALNVPPAGEDDWGFLEKIPRLKRLTIWHGHEFRSLAPFCDLPGLESATFGGCMGIRNRNRDTPEKARDVVFTLVNLPRLTRLTLYHSPLTPGDAQLAHIVKEFPNLVELRLDFAVPRGTEAELTRTGIEALSKLPLESLGIENAESFEPGVFAAFGSISTLETLVIHPARKDREKSIAAYEHLLGPVREAIPGLEVEYFGAPRKQ